jgi:uncharacterized membrane protein
MSAAVEAGTLAAAVTSGLAAGVFFAFSTFVMPALDRLAPGEAIAAMQSINRAAITPPFMALLFGTALGCLLLAAWALASLGERQAPWLLAGAALYLGGALGVTAAANVPLNDRLAKVDPHSATSARDWPAFERAWTRFNHVRTVAATAATALLTVAGTVA